MSLDPQPIRPLTPAEQAEREAEAKRIFKQHRDALDAVARQSALRIQHQHRDRDFDALAPNLYR